MTPWSWFHFRPRQVERRLAQLVGAGVIAQAPNHWQLSLGVAYMMHRLVTRPETVGVDPQAVPRPTRTWLRVRPLRFPVLLYKGAVNPLDHTGLGSSDAHVIRHLVGAFHPGDNFHYDLQLIAHAPGVLEALRTRVLAIVEERSPDAELLRDLVVYEGYHERLLAVTEQWLAEGAPALSHDNPDTTLPAFLGWCAAQPDTPASTLRAAFAGHLSFAPVVP
jgi:hypothetical protein